MDSPASDLGSALILFPLNPKENLLTLNSSSHDGGGNLRWNPGNQDPSVGMAIVKAVNDYARKLARRSPLRTKVERVVEYLVGSTSLMGYGSNRNWWQ